MKWNFLYLIFGGISTLSIILTSYKYNGNPIFASYHYLFWILALSMFIGAYFLYKYEND
jgi:hypothetical protein